MANVIAFVEARAGVPTPPSKFALSEGRRIADELGATVYALVGTGDMGDAALDALAAELGQQGADKVLLCMDPTLGGAILDATHGPLLHAVYEKLRPRVFLFPAGRGGEELAPALAVRTGAAYAAVAELTILTDPTPGLQLRRTRPDGTVRELNLDEIDRPVAVSLPAGRAKAPTGHAVEPEVIALPVARGARPEQIDEADDDGAQIETASTVVVIDGAVNTARLDALRAYADVAVVRHGDAVIARAAPAQAVILGSAPVPGVLRTAPGAQVIYVGSQSVAKGGPTTAVWSVAPEQAVDAVAQAVAASEGTR